MTKISTQPYKGARDFYPEDKAVQKWMFDKWRRVVERFGYVEYDAPILEPTDLYLLKGNQEIIEEQTYTFKDRGDRSVTIRTEMTPSVSRMVAGRRQELAYPLRWYSIPNLWRYERMQRGRLREFWQLNVDMFGVANENAELEMIEIVDGLFQSFKAKRTSYSIKLNSRLLVNTALQKAGLNADESMQAIRLIDRMNKMSAEDFAKALDKITTDVSVSKSIVDFLGASSIDKLEGGLENLASSKTLKTIVDTCKKLGITNVEFDPTLMRGFDYYTDIVFEAFDTDPENNRSILGGGRYDGLVGQMGVEPVPTIGFAVGDVVFRDFLETHDLLPNIQLSNAVTIVVRDETSVEAAQSVAREFRDSGVNVAVDFSGRKLDKQLKSAVKSGVRYVVFVGADETESGKYILKDLKTEKEEKCSVARIVSVVANELK
jgi:histidyl-tRNA synthetase